MKHSIRQSINSVRNHKLKRYKTKLSKEKAICEIGKNC